MSFNPEQFIPLLGWSSLWLAATGAMVLVLLRVLAIRSPRFHAVCWSLVLLQGVPFWTFTIPFPVGVVAENEPFAKAIQPAYESAALPGGTSANPVLAGSPPASGDLARAWPAVLFGIWALGVIFLVTAFLGRYLRFVRSLRSSPCRREEWVQQWDGIRGELGIDRGIEFHEGTCGPLLCRLPSGYRIVVPPDRWELLSEAQREAVLRHELAHFQRGDLWRALLRFLAVLPHWFNPMAWIAVRRMEDAAEWACDDAAAAASSAPDYASALLSFGTSRLETFSSAHFGKTGSTGARIRRLVADPPREPRFRRQFAMALLLLVLVATNVRVELIAEPAPAVEDDKRSDRTVPTDSKRDGAERKVTTLFDQMTTGEYRSRVTFPRLSWDEVPELMKWIRSERRLESFPSNPLSSQSQDSCTEGIAAMWLIDGIRYGSQFPALNPMLRTRAPNPAPSQKDAADAFERWWKRVRSWPAVDALRINPFHGTGIAWYGDSPRRKDHSKQTLALRIIGKPAPVVSVSDDGNYYCVMTPTWNLDGRLGGFLEVFRVGAVRDELVWRMKGSYSPLFYCLRGGTVLKLPKSLFPHLKDKLPDEPSEVLFYRNGDLLRAHTVKKMILWPEHVISGSIYLLYERDSHVWLSVDTQRQVSVQPNHIEFDLKTGDLTRTIDTAPAE